MNLRNIYIAAMAVSFLCLGSCTDNFDETNTNPNKVTVQSGKLQASAMLEQSLYGGANFLTYYTWFWCDELIQHTAFTGGTTRQEHRYFIGDQNFKAVWNTYARYASNANAMLQLARSQDSRCIEAVSLTLRAMYLEGLTAIFGDIPCSEAFKAESGISQPVFDSQEKVYQQLVADLDSANAIYASSPYVAAELKTLDSMYGMDMQQWRKFNNSLLMRYLMRISGRTATIVDGTHTVAEKMRLIVSQPDLYPLFQSNDDNATVRFTGTKPYTAYFDPTSTTESAFTTAGYKLTEQTVRMMTVKDQANFQNDLYEDPRLKIIGRKKAAYWKGTIAGAAMGEETNTGDAGAAYLNYAVLCRANSDEWLMDYAELQFILAEAALRGIISGGTEAARQYYEQAVTASLEKWGTFAQTVDQQYAISPDDIQTFLSSDLASWQTATTDDERMELIMNQKYLALFWTGMEDWHEYRRTGLPRLTVGSGCVYNDYILPTRFAYPGTTVATNRRNVEAALERMQGQNDMKTPLWFSLQAINEGK